MAQRAEKYPKWYYDRIDLGSLAAPVVQPIWINKRIPFGYNLYVHGFIAAIPGGQAEPNFEILLDVFINNSSIKITQTPISLVTASSPGLREPNNRDANALRKHFVQWGFVVQHRDVFSLRISGATGRGNPPYVDLVAVCTAFRPFTTQGGK